MEKQNVLYSFMDKYNTMKLTLSVSLIKYNIIPDGSS